MPAKLLQSLLQPRSFSGSWSGRGCGSKMPKHAKPTRNVEKDLWPYLVFKTWVRWTKDNKSSRKERGNPEKGTGGERLRQNWKYILNSILPVVSLQERCSLLLQTSPCSTARKMWIICWRGLFSTVCSCEPPIPTWWPIRRELCVGVVIHSNQSSSAHCYRIPLAKRVKSAEKMEEAGHKNPYNPNLKSIVHVRFHEEFAWWIESFQCPCTLWSWEHVIDHHQTSEGLLDVRW